MTGRKSVVLDARVLTASYLPNKMVHREGEMQIGDLYDKYQGKVDDSKSRRTLLRYLKKMDSYDILESEGATSSTTYKLAE